MVPDRSKNSINTMYTGVSKGIKLALGEFHAEFYVFNGDYDPEDSGIDSDDESKAFRRFIHQGREASSDEDALGDAWWDDVMNSSNKKNANQNRKETVNLQPRAAQDREKLGFCIASNRSSPPLYEVELTASDEDDDASVLELVIPMQSSRYQRVPTSSPKKQQKPVNKSFFYNIFCCVRK